MIVAVGGALALVQVGLVLLAMTGAAVVLRRRLEGQAHAGGRSSIRLTSQHAVHRVTIDGRVLLIGTGPSGPPSLLESRPVAPEPSPEIQDVPAQRGCGADV